MTANQRRPGFRLPWSSEDEPGSEADPGMPAAGAAADATSQTTADASKADPAAQPAPDTSAAPAPAGAVQPAPAVEAGPTDGVPTEAATAEPEATDDAPTPTARAEPATVEGGEDFMRDLVAAMRKVADEARESGVSELRTRADEQVRQLEADAERRREELRSRAETDIAGVGDWARAEAERIKTEAEQRVAARRAQLDQQLASETTRAQAETQALRARVDEYQRELDAYHAQLGEINDPAAFAAAAKRMPQPPQLTGLASPAVEPTAATPAPEAQAPKAKAGTAGTGTSADEEADATPVEPSTAASNGVPATAASVHPAEEEVLAGRLAELDASLTDAPAAVSAEPVTTEVVVKGLGSFGAITGFRQALSSVDGIAGVALSLGQTGEFVFRATHAPGFDVGAAITGLEGDNAQIETRSEGGLRVTLDRAR